MIWMVVAPVVVVALIGYACWCHDLGKPFIPLRVIIAGVLAFWLSVVVHAATVKPTTCNDLEKYSFLWYAQLCFLYEGSS